MNKITIAIDGYSSTGKSTIAKEIAAELGYSYIDTGAMYRAVTLYAIKNNYFDDSDFFRNLLIADLNKIEIKFVYNPELGFGEVYLNGENVEQEIRSMNVSEKVSVVATVSEIRKAMVAQQQRMGKDKGVVLDGRDIGTVVFPDAEVKIFMTAKPEVRAQRRFDELKKRGEENITIQEVLNNVKQRDHLDTSRSDSPLLQAEDSVLYDNSEKTHQEQFQEIMAIIRSKIDS